MRPAENGTRPSTASVPPAAGRLASSACVCRPSGPAAAASRSAGVRVREPGTRLVFDSCSPRTVSSSRVPSIAKRWMLH